MFYAERTFLLLILTDITFALRSTKLIAYAAVVIEYIIWLGINCIVLKGVRIDENTVFGAFTCKCVDYSQSGTYNSSAPNKRELIHMVTVPPNRTELSKLHVLLLTRSISFPNGLAPTQRVKLLAKGLVECGLEVTILCTQASEQPHFVENKNVKGVYDGIRYEYTPGTTIRSNHFLARRWNELRGILVAIRRLMEMKRKKQPCCVYYYGGILANDPVRWVFYMITQLFELPLVIEMNERPWVLAQAGDLLTKQISPFWGVKGVIVISSFLREWAEQEKKRMNSHFRILELPILVDVDEQQPMNFDPENPYVLFAGSPSYDQTIQFILSAMTTVWKIHPECRLVITGCKPGEPVSESINKMVREQRLEGRIELAGYLSRSDLLLRYSRAIALVIPLFDDIRSRARFPTKIGEYLASGRPIVTTNVGEVARYFVDRENAYVCAPGNPNSYGRKIIEVLNNSEESIRVGVEGRQTAEKHFHYSIHTRRLANFFRLLVLGG